MKNQVTCPNCGTEFGVEEVLSRNLKQQLEADYQKKMAEEKQKLQTKTDELEKKQQDFNAQKKKENELFQQRLDKKLEELRKTESEKLEEIRKKDREQLIKDREAMRNDLKQEMESNFDQKLKFQKEQIESQNEKIKLLRQKELELEKANQQHHEEKQMAEIEFEKRLTKERSEYEQVIIEREQQRNNLRVAELEKKLKDQEKLVEEQRRKINQGSQQLQGEVLELELESALAAQYPFDNITDVPKGIRGADILQEVKNNRQQICGRILYESKRTKSFGKDWVPKLKSDMLIAKADIGLIVTEVMPDGMNRFGQIDGIWVCTYPEFTSVSYVLRDMILKLHRVKSGEVNRTEKMAVLYDYIRSNEFVHRMQNIVADFEKMKNHLEQEKRAYTKIWAQREKQIESVMGNSLEIYGAIKGIAGDSVGTLKNLELESLFDEEPE